MKKTKHLILFFSIYSVFACRYTIREIGFSSLSNSFYTLYLIDENKDVFPQDLSKKILHSNLKPYAVRLDAAQKKLRDFVRVHKLKLPAYVLKDKNGRMLALDKATVFKKALLSPFQNYLVKELPARYATVLLVAGKSDVANKLSQSQIYEAMMSIENIMPNLPKSVENPPNLKIISPDDFAAEKTLLWSLGLESPPEKPTAFIFYGKGRLMGDALKNDDLTTKNIYRLLSFIGADCECGLDRKWMFGYQVPLLWGKKTQSSLQKILDFDVNNPMVLTEMGRILSTKKKVMTSDEAIAFQPVEISLQDELPVDEDAYPLENESPIFGTVFFVAIGFFVVLVAVFVFIFLRRTP